MRNIKLYLILLSLIALLLGTVRAETYTLKDGTSVSGDILSATEKDLLLKTPEGKYEHVPWGSLSNDSLVDLQKNPKAAKFVEPYIEQAPETKAKAKEIVIKPVEHPQRPTGTIGFSSLFSSPLGLLILFIVYAAGIYAAYEVSVFRGHPAGLTCGLAAIPFLGLLSPAIFVFVPNNRAATQSEEQVQVEAEPQQPQAPVEEQAQPPEAPAYVPPQPVPHAHPQQTFRVGGQAPAAAAPAQPAPAPMPATVTFKRGDFTFNRRFFETKMPGFFRVVPGEAEKDMVLYVKAARGEFVGKRITNVTQTEMVLQVFKDQATADEMIPFNEIMEVQIRHKDSA